MQTVYPIGTTVYQPDKCASGYTILWGGFGVRLIDMNGRTVNAWQVEDDVGFAAANRNEQPGIGRAHLQPDGNVLVLRGGMMSTHGKLQEFDWDGKLVWEYIPEGERPHQKWLGPHHDCWRTAAGTTLTVCREAVPDEHLQDIRPDWRGQTIYGDTILEIDTGGSVVWEWNSHGHLDLNKDRIVASPNWPPGEFNSTVCDWTHVNTVRDLPENRWFDGGDQRFRPGNVIISPRNLDTIYIIDRETKEVVWEYTGDYFGGLSGQHEPYMIPKGIPGEGNVLVFDNGASPARDLGHAGASYVLEIDPVTEQVVWAYDVWLNMHAPYTSSAQRLANGNTLICASREQRVFEVTPEKQIVWEHVHPSSRSYRYPYDYCPQTASLGRPKEVSVTAPKEMRVEPDAPLE